MHKETQTTETILAKDFHFLSLLKFALPTIWMMILMGLYTILDTIFVSRFINTDALSAITICSPFLYFIIGLASMFATGGNAIIGRKLGAGDENGARNTFSSLLIFVTILAFCITIIGILFIEPLLHLLGASTTLLPYCKEYLSIQILFVSANMIASIFQNFFVTAGKPGLGLLVSTGSGIVNIMIDYILVVILDMGIIGASLGTSIAYVIPTIIGILFFSKKKYILHFQKPQISFKEIQESCFNGAAELVTQLSTAITTFFFNSIMMAFIGENGVASMTVIIYSQFLLTTIFIGFSIGIAPIISFNYGGQRHKQLQQVFQSAMIFIGLTTILCFMIAYFGNSMITSLFFSKENSIHHLTTTGFSIFSFSFLCCGFNIFICTLFSALSNGKISIFLSFLRTIGFITLFLQVLPKYFSLTGVWLAVPLAELCTFSISIICIYLYNKTYHYI